MATNQQRKRLKILFTEGSSTSSREALYCLGPHHKIDIMDPSPFCQSRFSRFVRRWHRCPSYSREPLDYLRFLVRLLRSERYDVIFPTHEQVYLLSRVKSELQSLAGLTVPDFDSLEKIYDKASFSRLLNGLDLPQPETVIVRSRDELERSWDFPRYIKLAHGTAGQGVWFVENSQQLHEILDQCEEAGLLDGKQEFLVQKPIAGTQRDVGGVFQNGRFVTGGSCEGLVVGVGGASMQRVGTHRPEMLEHLRRVAAHLQWQGPLSLAAMYDAKADRYNYLEAGPRIGETVPALISGANVCQLVVDMSGNEPVDCEWITKSGIRTHQTFLILVSKALEGDGRRDILAELWRACRGKGMYAMSEDELTRPREDWLSLVPATAVTLLLLAYPPAARLLVRKTVENYALPGDSAQRIRQLSDAELTSCFQ